MPAYYPSVHLLWGRGPAHLVAGGWGSLPLGSPPASSTPDVPLTHPAPHGSDSAAPPGVRFPASVPAKGAVGDPGLSVLLYLPALGSPYRHFYFPHFFELSRHIFPRDKEKKLRKPKRDREQRAPRNKFARMGAASQMHDRALDSVYLVRYSKKPNAAPFFLLVCT